MNEQFVMAANPHGEGQGATVFRRDTGESVWSASYGFCGDFELVGSKLYWLPDHSSDLVIVDLETGTHSMLNDVVPGEILSFSIAGEGTRAHFLSRKCIDNRTGETVLLNASFAVGDWGHPHKEMELLRYPDPCEDAPFFRYLPSIIGDVVYWVTSAEPNVVWVGDLFSGGQFACVDLALDDQERRKGSGRVGGCRWGGACWS